jgi:hypothetical protein
MQLPESLQQTIAETNLTSASLKEIVEDVIEHTKQLSFRLMIASALLEKLSGETNETQEPAPATAHPNH